MILSDKKKEETIATLQRLINELRAGTVVELRVKAETEVGMVDMTILGGGEFWDHKDNLEGPVIIPFTQNK